MSYTGSELEHGEKPSTGWEYVLAFRAPDLDELRNDGSVRSRLTADPKAAARAGVARSRILARLRETQFSYSQLWVPAGRVVLVRLALPSDALHELAETQAFELELRSRYGAGFLAYRKDRQRCYVNYSLNDFFTPAQRLSITLEVLGSSANWGAGIDVEKLIVDNVLLDAYPLHDRPIRNELLKEVVFDRWWDPLFRPSFRRLKDYLGSRVALYFAFLNFYTRMLIGVSVISIPIFLLMKINMSARFEMYLQGLYGTILVFWATYFIKYWKRRNAILNVKWGNTDHDEDSFAEVRPQFIGAPKKGFYSKGGFVDLADLDASSISALSNAFRFQSESDSDSDDANRLPMSIMSLVGHYRDDVDFDLGDQDTGTVFGDLPVFLCGDKKMHRNRKIVTWLITILFTLLMIFLTFFLLYFKNDITRSLNTYSWGSAVPGVLTGVLIFCGENGWKAVYPILSKWENHRTAQAYTDSLIMKRFSFEFVASKFHISSLNCNDELKLTRVRVYHQFYEDYISLFYIAFVKPYNTDDPCEISPLDGSPDCMLELSTMVATLVITKATIQQLMELGIPISFIVLKRIVLWYSWWRSGEPASSELRQGLLHATRKPSDESSDTEDIKESGLNTFENSVEDYGELVIQYGYIALFGIAYPPATLVFFINNVMEMRSDAFKYLFIVNRAPADDAAHIGKWTAILRFLALSAVWTNAGIIVFTSDRSARVISDVSAKSIAIFFILKQLLYWMTLLVDNALSDIPGRTYRRKARQDYLIARWFQVGDKPYYKHKVAGQRTDRAEDEEANSDLLEILNADENTEA